MPKVTINDVEYDGEVGERLVDVARRNAAHIGFVCEGLLFFLFQTNLCRVLKGGENLNEPTDLEKTWLPQSWLDAGYRMACETTMNSGGAVEILTYPEELRRTTMNVFSPPEDTTVVQNAGTFAKSMGNVMYGQLAKFPFNIMGAVPIWMRRVQNRDINPTCLNQVGSIVQDTGRVFRNMTGRGGGSRTLTKIVVETED